MLKELRQKEPENLKTNRRGESCEEGKMSLKNIFARLKRKTGRIRKSIKLFSLTIYKKMECFWKITKYLLMRARMIDIK